MASIFLITITQKYAENKMEGAMNSTYTYTVKSIGSYPK